MEQKTLRDEFAMAALTGLLASGRTLRGDEAKIENYARLSYIMAEVMLLEREKYNKE